MMKKLMALSICSLMFCAFACSDDDDKNSRNVIDAFCEHEIECNTMQYDNYDICYEKMRGTYDSARSDRYCRSSITKAFLGELENMTNATCDELYDYYDGFISTDYFYDKDAENKSTDCQIAHYGRKYF